MNSAEKIVEFIGDDLIYLKGGEWDWEDGYLIERNRTATFLFC